MPFGRRGFLSSLFLSPVVAKEALEQDKTEQSEVKPIEVKPKCGICDSVLINGKCQFTKRCHYCSQERIRTEMVTKIPNKHAYLDANGNKVTYKEIAEGALDAYVHVVEDKCTVCGNAPDIPIYSGGSYFSTAISFPVNRKL